ncbi:DUF1289 domain-containing protein [uncultured Thiodictyon sp.]|uniref:DUF1289 domain-containing protein n=1 Tax=uncultured Thiodictyon sp. TaxID=1846217 RepID=UPI0025ED1A48|nr:DUF1289 domain-containing protein [uncultured Thiodictyon sp.]
MSDFEKYPCVGVCEDDPVSGYCQGCGRPPIEFPAETPEQVPPATAAAGSSPVAATAIKGDWPPLN